MNALCPGDCCDPLRLSHAYDLLTASEGAPTIAFQGDLILDLLDPRAMDVGDLPCRKFDRATRRCTIYEQRPQMCSDYPYENSCEFCDVAEVKPGEPISRYVPAEETGIFGAENLI